MWAVTRRGKRQKWSHREDWLARRTNITDLNSDLRGSISWYLDIQDWYNLKQTCKSLRAVARPPRPSIDYDLIHIEIKLRGRKFAGADFARTDFGAVGFAKTPSAALDAYRHLASKLGRQIVDDPVKTDHLRLTFIKVRGGNDTDDVLFTYPSCTGGLEDDSVSSMKDALLPATGGHFSSTRKRAGTYYEGSTPTVDVSGKRLLASFVGSWVHWQFLVRMAGRQRQYNKSALR